MSVLNQRPSEVVKMVEAGETVQITRHGRPVLRLVPEPMTGDPLDALEAAGLLTPARSPSPAPRRTTPLMSPEDADRTLAEISDDVRG